MLLLLLGVLVQLFMDALVCLLVVVCEKIMK